MCMEPDPTCKVLIIAVDKCNAFSLLNINNEKDVAEK